MHKVITGFALGTAALAWGLTWTACNIPDPGDMDRLLEALAEVPEPAKQELKKQTVKRKALEFLQKKDPSQAVGKVSCFSSSDSPDIPYEFERADAQRPTVGDVIDCLENGIKELHLGGVKTFTPEMVDYSICKRTVLKNHALKEEQELRRLASSDDPWEHWLDWPYAIDLRGHDFICRDEEFEEFLRDAVYGEVETPKDQVLVPEVRPHEPIPPEDIPEDWEVSDRRVVDLLFKLEKAPPIIQAAIITLDVAAASEFAAFVALVCLDASPGWGCASAPGLPGYDGPDIVIAPKPGGDK